MAAGTPVGERRLVASVALTVAGLVAPFLSLSAQGSPSTGAVVGAVTDAGSGQPVSNARVQALALPARTLAGAVTSSAEGRYRLGALVPGRYVVVVTRIGYVRSAVDTVNVTAGGTTTVNVKIAVAPSTLEQVVTTASRGVPEKVLDAPASVSVVSSEQIERKQSVTVADLIRDQPGVDATQGGLAQTNVVARGFNNAFSGSLLTLQDYRFAGVPSLRVNVPFLFTGTNDDIDRIEVLLGPAAALYGPNAANGVMHVITKSPFTSEGTTVSLEGGTQSLFRGSLRHAQKLGEKVAFKLSGEYFTATDFKYRDPAEPALFPTSAPAGRAGQANARDFDLNRYTAEARLDVRPNAKSEAVTTIGYTDVGNAIELTGANGASQIRNWTYTNIQQRFRYNKLFAQAFINMSDAGNQNGTDLGGTFLLRSGQPIVDQSRLVVGQLQHGLDLGTKQSFVYGGDYIWTNPRTSNTTNGLNEDRDNVTEYGAYLQSTTRFSPTVEFIAAARVDKNDRIAGTFFSPRAAISLKPTPTQNIRITFNRAFQTPANFSLFLDLVQGSAPNPIAGLPGPLFNIRAVGVNPENGIRFARTCGTGVGGLCMRTTGAIAPTFLGGANQQVDANAALFFPYFIGLANANNALVTGIAQQLQAGGLPAPNATALAGQIVTNLAAARPTAAQIPTVLRQFNPTTAVQTPSNPFPSTIAPSALQDIAPLEPTFVNNYEIGYKALLGDKFRVSWDYWFQQRFNFVTPAVNISATAFADGPQLGAYIAQNVAATAIAAGVPAANASALAQGVAGNIANTAARLPLGNVVPSGDLFQRNDVVFSYRNIDERLELFGTDIALDYLLTPRLTVGGNYSYMSTGVFPNIAGGNGEPLRLNAPQNKGTAYLGFQDPAGWGAELRYRYADAFRVNSGVYLGDVPVQNFVDASVNYTFRRGGQSVRWTINGMNLLDRQVPTFIGTPSIGRLISTRVSYSF